MKAGMLGNCRVAAETRYRAEEIQRRCEGHGVEKVPRTASHCSREKHLTSDLRTITSNVQLNFGS